MTPTSPIQPSSAPVDTICAISTPPGVGGIAVARVSGPRAIDTVQAIWQGKNLNDCPSHTVHLGTILSADHAPLDSAVATIFRAPRSFTGEDVVEISVHGSIYIQNQLIDTLCQAGARLAQPGEFTRRAFANRRLDLAQAEAVADVIASTSRAAHRLALSQMRGAISQRLNDLTQNLLEIAALLELELDFSEEDVQFASRQHLMQLAQDIHAEISRLLKSFATGNAIRQGIPVAIAGATNVGKSSLLNTLVGDNRAIVSNIHGTTRDLIEDTATIGDYMFRFTDTAGLRKTTDQIEAIGIDRALQAISRAHILIAVADPTAPQPIPDDLHQAITQAIKDSTHTIIVINKTDITDPQPLRQTLTQQYPATPIIPISALTGQGIADLNTALIHAVTPHQTTHNTNTPSDAARQTTPGTTWAADAAGQTTPGTTWAADAAGEDIIITNQRHKQALRQALEATDRVIAGIQDNISGDFIAQDLRDVIRHLATITGTEITTPDILSTIFSRFCIGK